MINFFLKKLLFLFSLWCFAFSAWAQEPPKTPPPKPPVKQDSINTFKPQMVDNADIGKLYVGCENLYHYRGMPSIKVIGKMGQTVVEQKDGFFVIQVAQPGTYALSIYDASSSSPQLLEEKIFEAVPMPDPAAAIAGKSSGFISRKELVNADSLLVVSKRKGAGRIVSFNMVLVNGKFGRRELESKTGTLTPEMKAAIRLADSGTTILFEYIRAIIRVRGAGISVNLPSVSFILQD